MALICVGGDDPEAARPVALRAAQYIQPFIRWLPIPRRSGRHMDVSRSAHLTGATPMARRPMKRPTGGELTILRVLWELRPCMVRHVHHILNETRPTAGRRRGRLYFLGWGALTVDCDCRYVDTDLWFVCEFKRRWRPAANGREIGSRGDGRAERWGLAAGGRLGGADQDSETFNGGCDPADHLLIELFDLNFLPGR